MPLSDKLPEALHSSGQHHVSMMSTAQHPRYKGSSGREEKLLPTASLPWYCSCRDLCMLNTVYTQIPIRLQHSRGSNGGSLCSLDWAQNSECLLLFPTWRTRGMCYHAQSISVLTTQNRVQRLAQHTRPLHLAHLRPRPPLGHPTVV